MGRGVNIPWIGCSIYIFVPWVGGGQNPMCKGVKIPWVGGLIDHGSGKVKIQLVGESKYHG